MILGTVLFLIHINLFYLKILPTEFEFKVKHNVIMLNLFDEISGIFLSINHTLKLKKIL